MTGDLLASDAEALVNAVNCVGVMGKGIALQFKRAFPAMFEVYRSACAAGDVAPGRLHVWSAPDGSSPRFVVNLPTKRHWRSKSRIDDVVAGIEALTEVVRRHQIRSIAIPPLGCGHGGLDWENVRPRLVDAFGDVEGVEVLLYEPASAGARMLGSSVDSGRMSPPHAAMLSLMDRYQVLQARVTLLEAQKLAYFLQLAGVSLGLAFRKHHYGPYAEDFATTLSPLEGRGVTGLHSKRPDGTLEPDRAAARDAATAFEGEELVQRGVERVAELVEGWETSYGMELLASTHWITARDGAAARDVEVCIERLHEWSPRKRRLMKPDHVRLAWRSLREAEWLPNAA